MGKYEDMGQVFTYSKIYFLFYRNLLKYNSLLLNANIFISKYNKLNILNVSPDLFCSIMQSKIVDKT